jgi:hypothetical protein
MGGTQPSDRRGTTAVTSARNLPRTMAIAASGPNVQITFGMFSSMSSLAIEPKPTLTRLSVEASISGD